MATVHALKRVLANYHTDPANAGEIPGTFTVGADVSVSTAGTAPPGAAALGFGSGFAIREYTPNAWKWMHHRETFGELTGKIVHVTFDSVADNWGQVPDWDIPQPMSSFWVHACHVVEDVTDTPV
jgi:hypothetical protein